MKVGIYCTNNEVYPLPTGTIYANMTIAGEVADGLADLGEDVTFFAPEGTKTKAKLITFGMLPFSNPEIWQKYRYKEASYQYEDLMLTQALNVAEKEQFDIFVTHCRPWSIAPNAAIKSNLQVISTIHDPVNDEGFDLLSQFNKFTNLHWVSISKAQQKGRPDLAWVGCVYNGVDLNKWKSNLSPGKYLLYIGRIMEEKGVDIAVQVALKTEKRLKIAGSIYDDDNEFFNTKIKPYLGEQIEYLGIVSRDRLPEIYGGAEALLMPIRWEEPFGLVMIEAMACGTPVIGFRRGSVSEIIENGVSGWIVDSESQMVDKINGISNISKISRSACRRRVEEMFSLEIMTKNYLELFARVAGVK